MGETNNKKHKWKCRMCEQTFKNRFQFFIHALIKHKKIDWYCLQVFLRFIGICILIIPLMPFSIGSLIAHSIAWLFDKISEIYVDIMGKILDKIFNIFFKNNKEDNVNVQ